MRMRPGFLALTTAAGCALVTDLDGLSDPPSATRGPLEDAAAPPSDGGVPADARTLVDAAWNSVFADDFESNAALPRAWDTAVGDLSVVSGPGASTSGTSRALHAISFADAAAAARLVKTVTTPAAVAVACDFTFYVTRYGGTFPLVLARLQMKNGTYVRLQVEATRWQYYGQQVSGDGGPSTGFTESFPVASIGKTMRARLEIAALGRVTVTVDGVTSTKIIAPVSTEQLTFAVGIYDRPTQAHDYGSLFDDVVCSAN